MSDIESLEIKIEKQSEKIDTVAASIHELAIAVRENTLEHKGTKEAVIEMKAEQADLKKRVHTLEVAQAGDDARKEIWGWAQKAAITVFVAALIGGAMMAFYGGKG